MVLKKQKPGFPSIALGSIQHPKKRSSYAFFFFYARGLFISLFFPLFMYPFPCISFCFAQHPYYTSQSHILSSVHLSINTVFRVNSVASQMSRLILHPSYSPHDIWLFKTNMHIFVEQEIEKPLVIAEGRKLCLTCCCRKQENCDCRRYKILH